MDTEQRKAFKKWFDGRPREIKDHILKCLPGIYKVKEGAPYSLSCPGTIGNVIAWNGTDVTIEIEAKDKLPECLEHEALLAAKYGKIGMIDEIHAHSIRTQVDHEWLEPVEVEDYSFLTK